MVPIGQSTSYSPYMLSTDELHLTTVYAHKTFFFGLLHLLNCP
jgi:hypothetical protein